MPDLLRDTLLNGPAIAPLTIVLRLAVAMACGGIVAFIYRWTRAPADVAPSFAATLVLLTILIAMVTQVIGDNVARAFSLVGALSIVRFRTVVRDTQDTAYVIFAVAVGMAVGAGHPWLAVVGMGIVAVAARLMRPSAGVRSPALPCHLEVRLAIGQDPREHLAPVLDEHTIDRRLLSMATSRQGMAVDVSHRILVRGEDAADALVRALNRIDGVQGVSLRRLADEDEGNQTVEGRR
jgi:uncharacterized membrane protein YhiD involved in acid resistance